MISLTDIRYAYLQGKDVAEINQMYKDGLAEVDEGQQLELWKQICSFANFEMVNYLISQGWRAAGTEDSYGNNLLHLMAEADFGNSYFIAEGSVYETTKLLLTNKVSPLKKNSSGETALMVGAKAGYAEMLRAYVEIGAKIDWTNSKGNTLLHISAEYSSRFESDLAELQKSLQAMDNDPNFNRANTRDMERRAELEWRCSVKQARFNQFINFVVLCLEFGVDAYQKNNVGETAIDVAVRYKSKVIGAILSGADLSNQETANLHIQAGGQDVFQACMNNDVDALNALIKLGESVNEQYDKEGDRYHGMLPLAIAIVMHHFDTVDLLLKNGADPMLLDSKAWHPLRYLYIPISNINTNFDQFENKTFQKILQSFIQVGFDIDTLMDDEENTLLTLSAKNADSLQLYNSHSVAKVIIKEAIYANADLNKTNREGISTLMYLCLTDLSRAENEIIVLLEQGASTDLKDKNGKTALIYASQNSDRSTAKTYCELLEQFGDILVVAKDNSEKSALDYAVEKNNDALVAWLLERQ